MSDRSFHDIVQQLRYHVKNSLEKNLSDNAVFFATQLESLTNSDRDKQRLAEAYFSNKQYQRAFHLLQKEQLLLTRIDSQYLAARCKAALSEWEECLKILNPSIASHNHIDEDTEDNSRESFLQSAIYLLRGQAFTALENRPKALLWFKKALECDVFCFEAFDCLSKGHLLTVNEGRELIDSLKFTSDNDWLKNLYNCKLRKYADTESDTPEIFSAIILPNNSNGHCNNIIHNVEVQCARSESLFYQNQFQKAYQLASNILTADPYIKGSILTVYVSCMVELKLKSQLFNFSHKLVTLYPNEPISWYSVGCYYFLIKNFTDARHYFSKSTLFDKDFGPAWLGFGHAFAMQGEHDQALAAYRSSHRLLIGSHLPPLCIGMELVKPNDLILAAQFISQAKDICPYDPLVFNELGVIEYKNGNYKEAMELFDMALGLLKGSVGVSDSSIWTPWEPTVFNLGHCYRKLGLYEEAFEQYMIANQLRPDNASTLTALGFCKHMMADIDGAIEYYHMALGIDLDDTIAETMLKKALQEFSFLPCPLLNGQF